MSYVSKNNNRKSKKSLGFCPNSNKKDGKSSQAYRNFVDLFGKPKEEPNEAQLSELFDHIRSLNFDFNKVVLSILHEDTRYYYWCMSGEQSKRAFAYTVESIIEMARQHFANGGQA